MHCGVTGRLVRNRARRGAHPHSGTDQVTQAFEDPAAATATAPHTPCEIRENVRYVTRGDQALAGTLYSPAGSGPHPAIVALHGGGWRNAGTDVFRYLGPWLAERGYVVFAPTYRLAKAGQASFPQAVHDVRAAVQFVKSRADAWRVAHDRIALLGESAGGHLAALVALAGDKPIFADGNVGEPLADLSTSVKAAICVYGIFDLAAHWRHDQLTRPRDHLTEIFLGTSLIEDRRIFFDASPLSYVSVHNNATAFLLAWGTHDDIVDPRQSEAFLEALKQARHVVRSVILPGATHYWLPDPLDEPQSFSAFFAHRLLRFLKQRL
jgi:acetyl esterase/lipase